MLHATAINYCDSIHQEFFVQTSYYGVDEQEDAVAFDVFPNPTDGSLNLRWTEMEGCDEIEVYNVLGQKVDVVPVDAKRQKEANYNMSELKDGTYYFVLKGDAKAVARKVLLKR